MFQYLTRDFVQQTNFQYLTKYFLQNSCFGESAVSTSAKFATVSISPWPFGKSGGKSVVAHGRSAACGEASLATLAATSAQKYSSSMLRVWYLLWFTLF